MDTQCAAVVALRRGVNMSEYGCPYRKDVFRRLLCTCSSSGLLDDVTGFVMCECDWESCPDYQKRRNEKIISELQRNCFSLDDCKFPCGECKKYLEYASTEQKKLLAGEE